MIDQCFRCQVVLDHTAPLTSDRIKKNSPVNIANCACKILDAESNICAECYIKGAPEGGMKEYWSKKLYGDR